MFLLNLRKRIGNAYSRDSRENGSDIIIMLFMLPVILALSFSIIDLSTYYQTKMKVLSAVEYSTRTAALQGGAGVNSPLNSSGVSQSNQLLASLYNSNTNQCTFSYCESRAGTVPELQENSSAWGNHYYQRTISPAPNLTPFKVWAQCSPCITNNIHQHVTCSAVYNYAGVGGPLTRVLGLGIITAIPIKASVTLQTETAFKDMPNSAQWSCIGAASETSGVVGN